MPWKNIHWRGNISLVSKNAHSHTFYVEHKLSLGPTAALASTLSWSFVSWFYLIYFFYYPEKHIHLRCVTADLSSRLSQAKWVRENFTKSTSSMMGEYQSLKQKTYCHSAFIIIIPLSMGLTQLWLTFSSLQAGGSLYLKWSCDCKTKLSERRSSGDIIHLEPTVRLNTFMQILLLSFWLQLHINWK